VNATTETHASDPAVGKKKKSRTNRQTEGGQNKSESKHPPKATNTSTEAGDRDARNADHGEEQEPKTQVPDQERGVTGDGAEDAGQTSTVSSSKAAKAKAKLRKKRVKEAVARKEASERRRMKRIRERHVETICFACREKGHAARDCTRSIAPIDEHGEGKIGEGFTQNKPGKNAVGICYRCGSRKHNLSRCREQADPSNPLPFASCFVCSGQGHLASSCPQNQFKGIYPNGGCCKLCGETTHLAKDCSLRKNEVAASTVFLGTGHDAGADEDDFHTFKRRNAEVDRSEKAVKGIKRQANIKMGSHTGVVKSFARTPIAASKKVVTF